MINPSNLLNPKEAKPKIAILSLDPRIGGGIRSSVEALYFFLENSGYCPTIFFLDFSASSCMSFSKLKLTSTNSAFTYQNMHCYGIGGRFAFWEPWHYSKTKAAWQVISDYDLIFVSSGTPFAAHPAVLWNKKFILWVATPFWADRETRILQGSVKEKLLGYLSKSFLDSIEKEILEKASVVLPMSQYAQEQFESITKSSSKIQVCGYPINAKTDIKKDFSKKIILAVGRFTDPRKNINMLLKIWDMVKKKVPDTTLLILGSLSEENKQTITKDSRAFFVESPSNEVKNFWYEQASLLLITSTQEGLGIVGLEALSYATPVVSTDCFGVKDFVLENETGFLCPQNNHTEMASIVEKCLNSTDLLKRLSQNGQNLITSKFSFTKIESIWQKAIFEASGYKNSNAYAAVSEQKQELSDNQTDAALSKQKTPEMHQYKNL